jgi:hypothetical protein
VSSSAAIVAVIAAAAVAGTARSSIVVGSGSARPSRSRSDRAADRVCSSGLETLQMRRDHRVARHEIWRGEDLVNRVKRHVELAESGDDERLGNLVGAVAPVAGELVDLSGLEQPNAVVVAKGLDGEVRGPGEVADADRRSRHHYEYRLSPEGRVNRARRP